MKAWLVREKDGEYATVVFAETRGKARAEARATDACEDADFCVIEAIRKPILDKYYKEGFCVITSQIFNATEEELLAGIAEWKRLYRRLERLGTQEAQDAWLEERTAPLFPKSGFPQFRIDELKRAEDSELLEDKTCRTK